jgi:3-deoxy-7-phosphoheptulonate synthase
VRNPLGVKLGADVSPHEAVSLCERLNPGREPGRLVLFTRMGADRVGEALPPILRAVSAARHPVVWACDPMHANTFSHASGYKTRRFADIMRELEGFFTACAAADVVPGGVHVELTGENVTECLGGSDEVLEEHLEHRYETMCDPRLNARQSLDLAFHVAELLRR